MNARVRVLLAALCLLAAGILLAPAPAAADSCNWIDVQLPYDQFGHLWNTENGTQGGDPKPWCAPTAIANSFRFLETRYPQIYDQKLTHGNLLSTRDALQEGWVNAGNVYRNGTGAGDDQFIWEAKVQWIEDFAPGTTVFGGRVYKPGVNLSDWYGASPLQNAYPTFDFLWGELEHKEDVEIGFYWKALVKKVGPGGEIIEEWKKFGHMVTLTSLKFCDSNGNKQWDADLDEVAQIDFIDPNDPRALTWCPLTMDYEGSGALKFMYTHGGTPYLATLDLAYSESPIPEPVTLAGLMMGIGGVAVYIRRRRVA